MSSNKKLHPDSEYLMQDRIGLTIAKGLSVLVKEQPRNPVDFFAKWLLQNNSIKKANEQQASEEQRVDQVRSKHDHEQMVQARRRAEKEAEQAAKDAKVDAFRVSVGCSDDLQDQLQDLASHLAEFTNSTAAYVGQVTKPIKGVSQGMPEDSTADAHVIKGAEDQIEFLHASKGADFMIGQTLQAEQGVTFDVLKADEEKPAPDAAPKHLIIPEVVREERMHYYQVPRLGSYMAIKLEYQSCLFEAAYDAALEDYTLVQGKIRVQEQEREEWEAQQEELAIAAEEANEPFEMEEKEWQEFDYAPFQTKKIQFVVCLNTLGQDRQFTKEEVDFALQTVRMYRDTWEQLEKKNLEHDVQLQLKDRDADSLYREHYATRDEEELEKVIADAIESAEAERVQEGEDPLTEAEKEKITKRTRFEQLTRAFHDPEGYATYHSAQLAEAEMQAQAEASPKAGEGDAERPQSAMSSPKSPKEEDKGEALSSGELDGEESVPPYTALVPEQWLERCREFRLLHVVKYARLFQLLFYLAQLGRADVCETDTNKLSWKKARTQLKGDQPGDLDLFKAIGAYSPFGPKESEFAEYQKLKFIQNNLDEINAGSVDNYSLALGKLYRWLQYTIELRIEDVTERRADKQHERNLIEKAQQEEEARLEMKKEQLNEEIAKWEELRDAEKAARQEQEGEEEGKGEGADQDEGAMEQERADRQAEFEAEFDDENPPVLQPPEVESDQDNDFNISVREDDGEGSEDN